MRNYECPNCGGAVSFQSGVAVYAVCPYCRSMVVRRDLDVESLGIQAVFPPDLSPLQIGTKGAHAGRPFTLVGRIRVGYSEGTWTEWLADFGQDTWGWVAESQGHFQISTEIAPPDSLPGVAQFHAAQRDPDSRPDPSIALSVESTAFSLARTLYSPGKEVSLLGIDYVVRDVKQTQLFGAEGELTFFAHAGREAISIDLHGPDDQFANIEFSSDGIRLFVGRYCQFADLQFRELRGIPGWTTEQLEPHRNQSDALGCPNCGAPVQLRAAGFSMSAVCGSCASVIDTSTPELKLIQTASGRQTFPPLIPYGARGAWDGIEYEMIGLMRKRDNYGDTWSEYLLFNPFHGFRWLVNFNGHWSLIDTLWNNWVPDGIKLQHRGDTYRLFAKCSASVTYVYGEFYWKTRLGETVDLEDYVCPPWVISYEFSPELKEYSWSRGRYVTPKEVQSAFNLSEEFREPVGIYLNQTNPFREKADNSLPWWGGALFVTFLIQLLLLARSPSESIAVFNLVDPSNSTNRTLVTREFEIKGGVQPIEIESYAGLNNDWLSLSIDLVNAKTKESRVLEQGIEYYSGWDDGPWTEGSQTTRTVIPSVDPGTYYLVIDPSTDPATARTAFTVTVRRGIFLWWNFFLSLGLLSIYPIYSLLRAHFFERGRWIQSDFTPYTHAETGSDSDDD